MDKSTIIMTSLILGGAGLMYSAVTNPLKQTALNGSESHKTTSSLMRLWTWYP